jgi:hypothetical protein
VRVSAKADYAVRAGVELAAAAIADAILDDCAPRRIACDALGEAQLAAWRRGPDDLAEAMLRASARSR